MKNYIKVPFADKDAVKSLGARWDTEMKSWYVPDDADKESFSKWESHDPSVKVEETGTRIYLNVPFAEKDEVKNAGGRWDGEKRQWYYLSDKDSSPFSKWYCADQPSENKQTVKTVNKQPQNNNNNHQNNSNSQLDDLDSDLDAILSLGD